MGSMLSNEQGNQDIPEEHNSTEIMEEPPRGFTLIRNKEKPRIIERLDVQQLPNEIMLNMFSYLSIRDIPSTLSISKNINEYVMESNNLFGEYHKQYQRNRSYNQYEYYGHYASIDVFELEQPNTSNYLQLKNQVLNDISNRRMMAMKSMQVQSC